MRTLGTASAVLLLLLPGCASTAGPPPSTYLVDARGDASPRYDIVRANFTELNGSLVLWIEMDNYAAGLPLLEARARAETPGGATEMYAWIQPDPGKTSAPQVRVEVGRVLHGAFAPGHETCWIPSHPIQADDPGPWYILIDLLHNMTGFADGTTVRDLRLRTTDPNGTLQDEAKHRGSFRVEGRPNPYVDLRPPQAWCPLLHEGRRLGY